MKKKKTRGKLECQTIVAKICKMVKGDVVCKKKKIKVCAKK